MTTVAEQVTCAASSLAGGEPLAGTATVASSWLLVEVRGAWGRDAVVDSGLAPEIQEALGAFPGKVLLVRPFFFVEMGGSGNRQRRAELQTR